MKIDYKLVDPPKKRSRPLRWVIGLSVLVSTPILLGMALSEEPGSFISGVASDKAIEIAAKPSTSPSESGSNGLLKTAMVTIDQRSVDTADTPSPVNIRLLMPGKKALSTVSDPINIPQTSINTGVEAANKAQPVADAVPAEAEIPATAQKTEPQLPWQTITVAKGDNLSKLLSKHGISAKQIYQLLALGKETATLKKIHPGDEIRFYLNDEKKLGGLEYQATPFKQLLVSRQDGKLQAQIHEHEREIRVVQTSGTIKNSLYLAGNRAGMSDNIIMQMVEIFGWDIDFALEIRKGDQFGIIYEEIYRDGKKIKDGKILAAQFINQNNEHRAVYFNNEQIAGGYYDPDGRPMKKAFLRTPVKFSRISSGFTLARYHPILKKWRSHRGVDYAAPTGTPVHATSAGRISTRGLMRGYGKVVMISHANKYKTVYGHLSRFAPRLKKGSKVKQGQIIGYVGQTGLATGPHLHYEVRINGKYKDPLKVKLPKANPLPKKYRVAFKEQTSKLIAQLDDLVSSNLLAMK